MHFLAVFDWWFHHHGHLGHLFRFWLHHRHAVVPGTFCVNNVCTG